MYMVLKLWQKAKISTSILGIIQEIELSWIEGQIGAIPVFENKEDALKFTDNDENLIIKITPIKGGIKQ